MSNTDWWDALYAEDTNPGQDTETPDKTRHQVPDRTRQDETSHDTQTGSGRVLTLNRPLEGPRDIEDLLTKQQNENDTEDTTPRRDTTATTQRHDSHDTETDDTTETHEDKPATSQDTETDDTQDTDTDTDDELTAKQALEELYRKIGGAFERFSDENDTKNESEDEPQHHRPRYEPPNDTRSPRAALADQLGNMPTRYRWPLYHLGAAAAGETLALTPWVDTGLVSYARDGAHIVAETGWLTTWPWWGTALAAAGLYTWSRHKHWLIAWPCTIPIASAVIGALLYTPNL